MINGKLKDTLCCFCGENIATTKDHIPPRSIFTKPRPGDLITVPSCLSCNQGTSGLDERFSTYLSLHVAGSGEAGESLFRKYAIPAVKHNKSIKRQILENTEEIFVVKDYGKAANPMYQVLWDSEAHDLTIRKMTIGLFYHHYKYRLPAMANIKVHWFGNKCPQVVLPESNSIGNGAFKYYFGKVEDPYVSSIWLYQFYDFFWSGAYITDNSLSN